eukprot:393102-Amphidinium_carterae.2
MYSPSNQSNEGFGTNDNFGLNVLKVMQMLKLVVTSRIPEVTWHSARAATSAVSACNWTTTLPLLPKQPLQMAHATIATETCSITQCG